MFRTSGQSKFKRVLRRLFDKINNDKEEIPRLVEIVNKINPDIIHIHGTEENFGLIQEFTNIPTLVSIQGILAPYLEKYYSGISKEQVSHSEPLMSKIFFNSYNYWYKHMKSCAARERKIFLYSKNIMGRTKWDKSITGLLSSNSSYFTGNEIIRNSFYKNEWIDKDILPGNFKIITTMSGGLYKGLETIVDAAQLLKQYPNISFQWDVIGQSIESSLSILVSKLRQTRFPELNINL